MASQSIINSAEQDNQGICEGLVDLLRGFISKHNGAAKASSSIPKLSMAIMVKLKDVFPLLAESCAMAIKELLNGQWDLVRQLFASASSQQEINPIICACQKLNDMMSSVAIMQLISEAQVREWIEFIIDNTLGLITEKSLTDESLSAADCSLILSLPVESLRHICPTAVDLMVLQTVPILSDLSGKLIKRLLKLFEVHQINSEQDMKFAVFDSVLEVLSIISGDRTPHGMSINQIPQFKEIEAMIIEAIRNASQPNMLSDKLTEKYFSSILKFLVINTEAFLTSKIGAEFVTNFSLHHYQSTTEISSKIAQGLRKFLHC